MPMREAVLVFGIALASACADRPASPSGSTGTSGSSDDATPATSTTVGVTGSDDMHVPPGDSSGGPAMDLPPDRNVCPERAEVALCIPPSAGAEAFCLCSRQSLGAGTVAVVGDLDRDGLDDALVRSARGEITAFRSTGDALETLESVEWPDGISASTIALQYVPALGVGAYGSLANGELAFGVTEIGVAPSVPTTLLVGMPDEIQTSWWFGDFDADGALDLAVARVGFVDLGTSSLNLELYLDATTAPLPTALFSEEVDAAIDSAQFGWFVGDIDADGFDDLWFQPFQPGFPQLFWGEASGLALPGQALPPATVHHAYDLAGDGARELLGYGWVFGGFVVTEQTSARSFQPSVAVPATREIEIVGNDVKPVALGERKLALALERDGALGIPPMTVRSAMGVTRIDALPDIAPMRAVLLESVDVGSFTTLDLDADGRDEILATLRDETTQPRIYAFDIVEG